MFVIVLLSVSDSGGDSSGTAGHVYELAVWWALACPPMLYLDMESSGTSHSFMYKTAAHATAPAIHACLFFAFLFDSRFLGFPSARASVLWPLGFQFLVWCTSPHPYPRRAK